MINISGADDGHPLPRKCENRTAVRRVEQADRPCQGNLLRREDQMAAAQFAQMPRVEHLRAVDSFCP